MQRGNVSVIEKIYVFFSWQISIFLAGHGPGGGGLWDGTPSKPPGGGGHGGFGGEAFIERKLYPSPGGIIVKEFKYGHPYLIGDGYHLLGGSSGIATVGLE